MQNQLREATEEARFKAMDDCMKAPTTKGKGATCNTDADDAAAKVKGKQSMDDPLLTPINDVLY